MRWVAWTAVNAVSRTPAPEAAAAPAVDCAVAVTDRVQARYELPLTPGRTGDGAG